jgi:hypothetical protein
MAFSPPMISVDCPSISDLKIMRQWVTYMWHICQLLSTTQSAWCGTSKACTQLEQLDNVNMDLHSADRALEELWESVIHSSNVPNDTCSYNDSETETDYSE